MPYEEIALCMACEDIIARHNDKEYLMARYSTMEKAQKAMEMLRTAYTGRFVTNADISDDFEEVVDVQDEQATPEFMKE